MKLLLSKQILILFLLPVRELLGKAEVCQANVSFTVQQDVLRFQVTVDNVFRVEVLNGAYNFRGIEEACGVAEAPSAAQVAEQFAARHVVHQHIKEALIVVGPEPENQQTGHKGGIIFSCFSLELLNKWPQVILSSVHICPACPLKGRSVKVLPDELRKSDKIRGCISLRQFYPPVWFGAVCNIYFSWKGPSEE